MRKTPWRSPYPISKVLHWWRSIYKYNNTRYTEEWCLEQWLQKNHNVTQLEFDHCSFDKKFLPNELSPHYPYLAQCRFKDSDYDLGSDQVGYDSDTVIQLPYTAFGTLSLLVNTSHNTWRGLVCCSDMGYGRRSIMLVSVRLSIKGSSRAISVQIDPMDHRQRKLVLRCWVCSRK